MHLFSGHAHVQDNVDVDAVRTKLTPDCAGGRLESPRVSTKWRESDELA